MGAWGYGYKKNDNYFNEAGRYVTPLVKELVADMMGEHDVQDLRARLMWTVNVLKGTKEEVVLSATEVEVFHDAVHMVAEEAIAGSGSWREPKAYLAAVEAELESVEEWLETLQDTGALGNRLGSLLAAIDEKDKQ